MTSTTTASRAPAEAAPSTAAPARLRTSRRALLIRGAGALLVVAAAGYGYHWWTESRFTEETDDAYVGGDVTLIAAKVPGYVAEVLVTDNQQVHAGDLLARIDDRDYRAALAKAEGAVASEQAQIANLDARGKLQQAVIAEARAGVAAVDAETKRARDDQARYASLVEKSAVSIQSSQKADADYKQSVANGQKAKASAEAALRQLDVIATQRQQAQASLTQAIAERDIARLNLGYTELRAPVDGTVGNRRARVGVYAPNGGQSLSIVPARGLWVDANFKEGQLAHMRPGMRATIVADVMPGKVFHGRVESLAPATGAQFSVLPPENATGNFTKIVQRVPVRIVLDDEDARLGTLRPGLSVVAEVDTKAAKVVTADTAASKS
ncbi:MAG: HlyD family secretion protein [Pseudomonadota bacterium]